MSQRPFPNVPRRGEHEHNPDRERPYRRAHHASEAVVARYLNEISGRVRGARPVRRGQAGFRLRGDGAAC
jgi:hypothetical protein